MTGIILEPKKAPNVIDPPDDTPNLWPLLTAKPQNLEILLLLLLLLLLVLLLLLLLRLLALLLSLVFLLLLLFQLSLLSLSLRLLTCGAASCTKRTQGPGNLDATQSQGCSGLLRVGFRGWGLVGNQGICHVRFISFIPCSPPVKGGPGSLGIEVNPRNMFSHGGKGHCREVQTFRT